MNKSFKIITIVLFAVFAKPFSTTAQVTLNADGQGNTYDLINGVLAPNGNVIESPDLANGSHRSFGKHIVEVFDKVLNKYVFEFYAHIDTGATAILDNDIATLSSDRQRVEIKTYAASPDNLKGTLGETITYKWRFQVPVGFQPSANFTHIHQIKAVGGDDDKPIFTLTARKGTPNQLQLIYVMDATTSNDYKKEVNLSLFEGVWVEAVETIKVGTGTSGSYAITIKKVSDGTVILSYTNNSIQTIRTAATAPIVPLVPQVPNSFIRPKWGIYRSLTDFPSLRDESLRFSDFSIAEGTLSSADYSSNPKNDIVFPNPVNDILLLSENILALYSSYSIYDSNSKLVRTQKLNSNTIDTSFLKARGVYFVKFLNDKKVSHSIKIIKE
jgi:hypothetical protein